MMKLIIKRKEITNLQMQESLFDYNLKINNNLIKWP